MYGSSEVLSRVICFYVIMDTDVHKAEVFIGWGM